MARTTDEEGESSTIKRLRERNREQTKQLREREAHRRAGSSTAEIEIGPKPTLESCDYDEERYESELDAWKDRKVEASAAGSPSQEQNRRANESWQQDVTAYVQRKTTLGVSDYEISEAAPSAPSGCNRREPNQRLLTGQAPRRMQPS
jgi:hypothetical protein